MNDNASRYRVAWLYLSPSGEHPGGLEFGDGGDPRVPPRSTKSDDELSFEEKVKRAEAQARRERQADEALQWVNCAISPITDHLASLGAIRADMCSGAMLGLADPSHDPEFFFIYEDSPDAPANLATLANLEAALATVSCDELAEFELSLGLSTGDEEPWLCVQALFDAMLSHKSFAGVGIWGGTGTPACLPQEGECLSDWLERVALSSADVASMVGRWEEVGQDIDLFKVFGTHLDYGGTQSVEWLVSKVLARGCVTSLVGTNGVGKSTIAHEVAAILAGEPLVRPRMILGQEVEGHHAVALVSGEDSPGRVNERSAKLATVWGVRPYYRFFISTTPWKEIRQSLRRTRKLDLVIIDPLRAVMAGNEDISGDVSDFYDDLGRLARERNCAVLVVHHLSKGRPRRLSDMRLMVRGSGVHVDRPRMVIGILGRSNGLIEIGPLKHNFDGNSVWAELYEGALYQRDPASDTLIPIADVIENSARVDRTDRVLAAIAGLNCAGRIVRRSGKSGLFEMRLPELAGLSRNAILEMIEGLTESGAIRNSPDSGLVAEKAR